MQNNSEANNCRPEDVSWQIKQTNQTIKRYMDSHIAQMLGEEMSSTTGLHAMVLGYVSHQTRLGQDVYQRDLERQFHISRSTVTGILQLMEQNGLITREPVPQDARLKKLVLTEKAHALHQATHVMILDMEQQMRSGISQADLETTVRVLAQIRTNLSQPDNLKKEEHT